MNGIAKRILQTLLTQGLILMLAVVTGFVMPAFMGEWQYGYWALYLFYVAYLNLISMGYSDGYTLIHAGSSDEALRSERHRTAFALLAVALTVLGLLGALVVQLDIFPDAERTAIFTLLALNIPNVCLQSILLSILLAANRSSAYNNINLALKLLSTLMILLLFALGQRTFFPAILADSLARLALTLVCAVLCRKHIWGAFAPLREGLRDIKEKCSAGIQVTLSFVLASVMPLAGRVVLEHRREMRIYGAYSFAMTLLTIIISFTSTIGVVIFPMMRTINTEVLKSRYYQYRYFVDHVISLALLVYVLIQLIVTRMMTQFTSILSYVGILLAMSLPIARTQLILTPFYKTLRLERVFLFWNALGFAGTLTLCWISYSIYASPYALALASLVSMLVWSYAVERYLRKHCLFKLDLKHELLTGALLLAFIFASMRSSNALFLLLYVPALLLYTLLEWGQLKPLAAELRGKRP